MVEELCAIGCYTIVEGQQHIVQFVGSGTLQVICNIWARNWMYGIWAMKIAANQGHNNRSENEVERL